MTIMIPTGDLTGILADCLPFASTDRDDEVRHAIRIEWDGTMLHAFSTDGVRAAWSAWTADDEHQTSHQEDLFTKWGGGDLPWSLTLAPADAKDLVTIFKLSGKEYYTPLVIEETNGTLKVVRRRDSGHPALTAAMPDQFVSFPDIRKLLADNSVGDRVPSIAFSARQLADFAKVRPRGPLELTFTGQHKPVLVAIGSRFQGAIMPHRPDGEAERTAAVEVEDAVEF